MSGRRVLITGVGSYLGTLLARRLEREPGFDAVFALDTRRPRRKLERTVDATIRGAEERLTKGRRSMTEAIEGRRPATADDIKDLQKELRAIGRRLDRIEESLPKKRGGSSAKRGSKS